MITDVVLRSLRSRSRLISVEELINGCDGSRMPEVVPESLTVPIALKLADVCPTQAITTESRNTDSLAFHLDYGECIGCGRCVDAGEGAVRLARTLSRCGVPREALVRTWHIGSQVAEEALVTPEAALNEFHALLGRALNIRQLDPGSCNGCEAEITALANPYYDLERFGIHFVASPKHADMLLVTGPITRNMATAVRRTYEAVPAPKLVVAVGACGCSAGVFDSSTQRSCSTGTLSASNEEIVGPVDSLLSVDGYIPGCPPTPAMLVSGILRVLRRTRK
jgi:Ni,Fe-hydrogenase III small subunit